MTLHHGPAQTGPPFPAVRRHGVLALPVLDDHAEMAAQAAPG
jgi:hypothetical protein